MNDELRNAAKGLLDLAKSIANGSDLAVDQNNAVRLLRRAALAGERSARPCIPPMLLLIAAKWVGTNVELPSEIGPAYRRDELESLAAELIAVADRTAQTAGRSRA